MKILFKNIRHPLVFLLFSIVGALLFRIDELLWLVGSTITFLIFFRLRVSLVLIPVFLLINFLTANSAFILDKSYENKKTVYYTTKGYFKNLNNDPEIGTLIWGKYTAKKLNNYPYVKYGLPESYKEYKIFIISKLLKLRIDQSNSLYYNTGGIATTTTAHTFAVRKFIDPKLNDDYIITGLSHLLAMSGFHVGVFSAGIFLILSFLPVKIRMLFASILLPLLIPLSGFTVTVVRAVVFACTYFLAYIFDLKVKSTNFLYGLASFIIIFSPLSMWSISFLLSFFAVFGILVFIKKRYSPIKSIIYIGIASTVFTLPIQLYYFGTSNIASVITTMLMTPVVWAQMALGLLYLILPSITIAPLVYIETFASFFMDILTKLSWPFMYVAKPPSIILFLSFILGVGLCFTKYKVVAILTLLIPLLPVYKKDCLIIPALNPSSKGFIIVSKNKNEVFYQGRRKTFVQYMVPEIAKVGRKSFEKGFIKIYDGKNSYISIDNTTLSGLVCVNKIDESCKFSYMTRSNTLKPPLPANTEMFFIYSNKYQEDDRIYQISKNGSITIKLE